MPRWSDPSTADGQPRSWANSSTPRSGVGAWDQRMVERLQHHRQQSGQRFATRRGLSDVYEDPAGPSVPAWMRPSPTREHPIVRATAARAVGTPAEVPGEPFDDEVDSCLLSRQRRPWKRFWGDMWSARFDRESLHFLWRLTHRGLNIGASRLPTALHQGQPDALGACLCSAATCDGLGVNIMEDRYGLVGFLVGSALTANAPLETHLHLFWECPTVQPAIVWLWQLWQQIVGQAPPMDPLVLVSGDYSIWAPPTASLRILWLRLRVALLHATWQLRNRRRLSGQAFTAQAIKSAAIASLTAAMHADFSLATQDLSQQSGLGAWWFRGNEPPSLAKFKRVWCHNNVLAHVEEVDGSPALKVHFP